jgi:hypothetical protein
MAAEYPREAPSNASGNPRRLSGDGVEHRLPGPAITLVTRYRVDDFLITSLRRA